METTPTNQEVKSEPKKKRKWGWLLISFAIFSTFKNIKIDEAHLFTGIFYLLSLGLAPVFYYWVRPKIKIIKNERTKNFVVGLAVVFVFIFAISFLGALGDRIILKTPSDQTLQERDAIIQKTNEAKIWFQDWQVRWDKTQKDIVDDTDSQWGYLNNVAGYQTLQKLNAEKYNKTKEVFDVVAKYLPLFSNYDMSNMYRVSENLNNSYDELFKAKVDYFQSLLDKKSATEIEARRLIANEKAEKAAAAENEAQAVVADYNKALAEVFKK